VHQGRLGDTGIESLRGTGEQEPPGEESLFLQGNVALKIALSRQWGLQSNQCHHGRFQSGVLVTIAEAVRHEHVRQGLRDQRQHVTVVLQNMGPHLGEKRSLGRRIDISVTSGREPSQESNTAAPSARWGAALQIHLRGFCFSYQACHPTPNLQESVSQGVSPAGSSLLLCRGILELQARIVQRPGHIQHGF